MRPVYGTEMHLGKRAPGRCLDAGSPSCQTRHQTSSRRAGVLRVNRKTSHGNGELWIAGRSVFVWGFRSLDSRSYRRGLADTLPASSPRFDGQGQGLALHPEYVRVYGRDYADHLEHSGFYVQVIPHTQKRDRKTYEQSRLSDDNIYYCTKQYKNMTGVS